jgi:cytochrome P450
MGTYDPFAHEVIADPYPWYRWLCSEAPCYHVPERDVWVISRYDDVVAAARNHGVFSSGEGIGYGRRGNPSLISRDPPEHTRLRRLVAPDFLPRSVAALRPRIQEMIDRLLETMLERGRADWATELAEALPMIIVAEMLGIPSERRDDFKRWSDDLLVGMGPDLDEATAARIEESTVELVAFLRETVAERRVHPTPEPADLISRLVRATDADTLTEGELVSLCVLLIVAGNETTTSALSGQVVAVVEHPDQWQLVVRDPLLLPAFVEESLRHDSPVQAVFRNTLSPVEVAGTEVPAGAKVLMLFGAANRDPRHYRDPDALLVARNPVDHLAFGSGIHFCLGAPLARLELTLVAQALREKVGYLALAGEIVRSDNPFFRTPRHLPVVVEPR